MPLLAVYYGDVQKHGTRRGKRLLMMWEPVTFKDAFPEAKPGSTVSLWREAGRNDGMPFCCGRIDLV